jgi:hypothetical protein
VRVVSPGRLVVRAKIENLQDVYHVQDGSLSADQVRTIEVDNAVVDTRSVFLLLALPIIRQLGLRRRGTRKIRTTAGYRDADVYGPVQLTVQGRDCQVEVFESSDDRPVVIGRLVVESMLDFVVDEAGERLIGNPAHGGEQRLEMY